MEEINLNRLDGLLPDTYYLKDFVPERFSNIYGKWKVISLSGGFIRTGAKSDFDFLVFKKNGIFGIIRNDSLLTYGKITLLPDNASKSVNGLFCRFDFEKSANIELYADPEKYINPVNKDSLDLIAPCCDRMNIHLIRVN
jgi:hypothetical protein